MKRKILMVMCLMLAVFSLSACTSKKSDAVRFKNEYESLNGKENSRGVTYRTISIDKENPFVYTTAEEIVKKVENKETFFVYFGDTKCPWCRSTVEKAIEVSKKFDVKEIFYVSIWDEEGNEILRDKYEANEDGTLTQTVEGTEAYHKLIEYFKDVLRPYTLTDSKGKSYAIDEKRIFAPSYIYVKNGEAQILASGISPSQSTSTSELTDKVLEDEEAYFTDLFSMSIACEKEGC